MSRLGQTSISEQKTQNWAVFQMKKSIQSFGGLSKEKREKNLPLVFVSYVPIQFYVCCLFIFSPLKFWSCIVVL